MPKSVNVGERIKLLRESKNISREELAQKSGLSVEQISSIEEDSSALPALAPLIKISRALGVRVGTFLDDYEDLGPVISRKNESQSFSNNDMNYFALSKTKAGRNMEPLIIEIAPMQEANSGTSSHEGEEFIYVLEGTLEVNYGKETYILEQGDSIYYDSIVEHRVSAYKGIATKVLAVLYTPF